MADLESRGSRHSNPSASFSSLEFNQEKYIQKLVADCIGLSELQQQKQRLQGLSEECSTLLKRNVYHNYTPLIETSKEISNLEGEVYQMSHLLSEQRKALLSLLDVSVVKDKTPSANPGLLAVRYEKKEEQERELAVFVENIEGFSEILESGRKQFIYQCDMIELDAAESTAIQRAKGLVFAERFVVAAWLPNVRGNKRYKVTAQYKQDEVAVVNVRDLGPVRHAFKILLPNETRVFQCADADAKVKMMKAFEDAKQARLKPAAKKRGVAPPAPSSEPESSGAIEKAFFEAKSRQSLQEKEEDILRQEFLFHLQKLEVSIVERNFEASLQLLKHLQAQLEQPRNAFLEEHIGKLSSYDDELVAALCAEFEPVLGSSVRKPTTVNRAMQLLAQMGRSTLANKCFVHYHRSILKEQLRDGRMDSDVLSYVMKMVNVYSEAMKHATGQFIQISHNNIGVAYLITWARDELLDLCSVLKKQIFSSEMSLLVISTCVTSLRMHFKQLASEVGFDLAWEFEGQIRVSIDRSIRTTRGKFLDATKVRAQEDSWRAVNLLTLASANKFRDEMEELGVKSPLEQFVRDGVQLQLTQSTYQFSKGFLTFAKGAVPLAQSQDTQKLVEDVLVEAGNYQLRHIETRSNKKKDDRQNIMPRVNTTNHDTEIRSYYAYYAPERGDVVFVHSAAATPTPLLESLAEHGKKNKLHNVTVCHIHIEGNAPHLQPDCEGIFRDNSFFMGANVRGAVNEGRADCVPIFLSEIPLLFKRGIVPVDVALIQVSPPDKHGFCSMGVSVDVSRMAVQCAKHIIGQVNPQMPRTFGDGIIHMSHFDAMVEHEMPLHTRHATKMTEVEDTIGKLIAENLVDNGATLQMGIGNIPDAVLASLMGHKDLGIHSEMFSDGVVDLVEAGCITNHQKKVLPGKIVGSFIVGSKRLYDFLDNNPFVVMGDVQWVNYAPIIAQNPKVTAINSCIEVDLTGQVVSDSIGKRMYSGVGGQVDFLRGAAICPDGGKPILALPSTTKRGESKIVPYLKEGGGVVTTRAHVHYIVTEYGIAYLFGKNLRQRAHALIQVAHPDHRAALEKSAFERLKVMPSP